jgi:acyl dehydratase
VFFGDTIRLRLAVHDVIPSKSKPDRGIVKFFMEMVNQNGDVVQSGVKSIMMKRKPAGNQ